MDSLIFNPFSCSSFTISFLSSSFKSSIFNNSLKGDIVIESFSGKIMLLIFLILSILTISNSSFFLAELNMYNNIFVM